MFLDYFVVCKLINDVRIDVEKIQNAMTLTLEAIHDVEKFKAEALPGMKEAIKKLNQTNLEASAKINQLERGNSVKQLDLMAG